MTSEIVLNDYSYNNYYREWSNWHKTKLQWTMCTHCAELLDIVCETFKEVVKTLLSYDINCQNYTLFTFKIN